MAMIVLALPDIPQEDKLLARARNGDQQAVMDIYNAYAGPIYQYIRLRVGDAGHAEDLTSEVFLHLVDALRGRNAPRTSLRGWLFKVARNRVARHYRDHIPHTSLHETFQALSPDIENVIFQNITIERTLQAMHMLKAEQQEVIMLRFGQALTLIETADVMGKSVSAIKSLQFRAIETLRDILGEGVYG
jgi:RNA polymerase sigma-70 factor (ECF subfamily)